DELVGNIPTEIILTTLAARGVATGIDTKSLAIACAMTGELREKYAVQPNAEAGGAGQDTQQETRPN
ncbi:MAG: hypothetical protein ACRD3S_06530, partial [Terracidiphilus sp.]